MRLCKALREELQRRLGTMRFLSAQHTSTDAKPREIVAHFKLKSRAPGVSKARVFHVLKAMRCQENGPCAAAPARADRAHGGGGDSLA